MLIDEAKQSGADAVKFQTWITEKITTKHAEKAEYQIETTGTKGNQFSMLKSLELSFRDFHDLKAYADMKDILFISTPGDAESANALEEIDVPAFKIGSDDLTNTILLEHVATKKKPIILSTGMASLREVGDAIRTLKNKGGNKVVLMHCVSNYPTSLEECNLRAMKTMATSFGLPVGFSDHTRGIDAALCAVALDACIIEKHLTLSKAMRGPDHRASLNPLEFACMVKAIRRAELILGSPKKRPTLSELRMRKIVRKSVVAAADIPKGTVIQASMLAVKRPGTGVTPNRFREFLGRTARRDIKRDELLNFRDILRNRIS